MKSEKHLKLMAIRKEEFAAREALSKQREWVNEIEARKVKLFTQFSEGDIVEFSPIKGSTFEIVSIRLECNDNVRVKLEGVIGGAEQFMEIEGFILGYLKQIAL